MSLEDLYRQVILDHYRSPRNRGTIDHCDAHGEGHNPLCGDEISLDLTITDDTVTDVAISGQGCSISQASASMMSEAIKGKTIPEVESLIRRFKAMMDIEEGDAGLDPDRPGSVLGDLEALQGVRKFPVRIKCASLPWTTLEQALASRKD
ncbi:MAG: SUF system NifU family Fe-S cluster assembly protein [Gammaproteobacteria bacterium]|nr:SUF system NifU family Fe-S cluster assembly protein [Gammaproteobacteria bacterium]